VTFPLVVSFYTPEYECEIGTFCESLERFGMEYELTPIKNLGNWRRNVGYKPKFLIEQLIKHNQPVLFVDVDAFVEGPCEILNNIEDEYDFAGRFTLQPKKFNRPGDIRPTNNRKLKTITSGTLWFNNTELSMAFLRQWMRNERGQYLLGQLVLAETWHHDRPEELRTFRLPIEYCWQVGHPTHEGYPVQIRHTRGAQRHRTAAGKYDDFARASESMRVRSGMRWQT